MEAKRREQQRAQKLRTQGKSINEIVARLGISKSSASLWVRNIQISADQVTRLKIRETSGGEKGRNKLRRKWQEYRILHPLPQGPRWPKRPVETFFHTWAPEMAYVLGYFAADGCMYRNKRGSYYVGFVSTDKELIETVKRLMGVTNAIEKYQSPHQNYQLRYTLQIGSKKLYQRLIMLGFTPRKSLTLTLPHIPKEFLGHFVRGHLDGDGCVVANKYKRSNRPGITRVFCIKFTSGSRVFLESLRDQISQVVGVSRGTLLVRTSTHFVLQYGVRDSRQLYSFLYPTDTVPRLERKHEKFKQGMK